MRHSFPRAGLLAALLALFPLSVGVFGAELPYGRSMPPAPDTILSADASGAPPSMVPMASAGASPSTIDCVDPMQPLGSPSPESALLPAPSASLAPAPSVAPAPDQPATARARYKVRPPGIRLELPDDWLALKGDDLPELQRLPVSFGMVAAVQPNDLTFLGVDPRTDQGCPIGGLVSLSDLGKAVSHRRMVMLAETMMMALASRDEVDGNVALDVVMLPVGEICRLTFRTTADPGQTSWWVRADVFVAAGRTILALYTAPDEAVDGLVKRFSAIAKSMRAL